MRNRCAGVLLAVAIVLGGCSSAQYDKAVDAAERGVTGAQGALSVFDERVAAPLLETLARIGQGEVGVLPALEILAGTLPEPYAGQVRTLIAEGRAGVEGLGELVARVQGVSAELGARLDGAREALTVAREEADRYQTGQERFWGLIETGLSIGGALFGVGGVGVAVNRARALATSRTSAGALETALDARTSAAESVIASVETAKREVPEFAEAFAKAATVIRSAQSSEARALVDMAQAVAGKR